VSLDAIQPPRARKALGISECLRKAQAGAEGVELAPAAAPQYSTWPRYFGLSRTSALSRATTCRLPIKATQKGSLAQSQLTLAKLRRKLSGDGLARRISSVRSRQSPSVRRERPGSRRGIQVLVVLAERKIPFEDSSGVPDVRVWC
jgi:hypothetical protein